MQISPSWLLFSLAVIANPVFAINEGCAIEKELLVCNVRLGQTRAYTLDGIKTKSLKIVNNTDEFVQVSDVWVQPAKSNSWGEYCLSIRDWRTGQNEPGYGEVGCLSKNAADPKFGVLRWDSASRGLSVAPGQAIYVGGYVQAPPEKDHRKTVQVTVQRGTGGVYSFRQPRLDVPIRCTGKSQSTAWAPWQNKSGRSVTITGATIYAVDPARKDAVEAGCLYVLDSTGKDAKWKYCTNVNVQGRVSFAPISVAPDDYIAAQAKNTCKAGGLWDWAAYIYTTARE